MHREVRAVERAFMLNYADDAALEQKLCVPAQTS